MEIDLQRFYNANRRILMWAAFFGILYLLRHFFAVMFLTFIFGFVMRRIAKAVTRTVPSPYWAAVVALYAGAVSFLVLLLVTAVPRVVEEGVDFSRNVPHLLRTFAVETRNAARAYGFETVLARYVNEGDGRSEPAPGDPAGPHPPPTTQPAPPPVEIDALVEKMQDVVLGLLPGAAGSTNPQRLETLLLDFLAVVRTGTLQFLLAILLSFLIVLDFDRIAQELTSWRARPVGRFFHEAAASVVEFSGVVGIAFQCQLLIALLNASITSVGLAVLKIEPLLLLTTIVFLLGLIPVLGVFISSVPIILIAFNKFGLAHALAALGVIVVVHILEAYVFNPRIYAARFHLNPVIVLIILLVAHELFGVWGMLLGIPVTHYVLNIAQLPTIPRRRRAERNRDQPPATAAGPSSST